MPPHCLGQAGATVVLNARQAPRLVCLPGGLGGFDPRADQRAAIQELISETQTLVDQALRNVMLQRWNEGNDARFALYAPPGGEVGLYTANRARLVKGRVMADLFPLGDVELGPGEAGPRIVPAAQAALIVRCTWCGARYGVPCHVPPRVPEEMEKRQWWGGAHSSRIHRTMEMCREVPETAARIFLGPPKEPRGPA